jgi:hypothetical protein
LLQPTFGKGWSKPPFGRGLTGVYPREKWIL